MKKCFTGSEHGVKPLDGAGLARWACFPFSSVQFSALESPMLQPPFAIAVAVAVGDIVDSFSAAEDKMLHV